MADKSPLSAEIKPVLDEYDSTYACSEEVSKSSPFMVSIKKEPEDFQPTNGGSLRDVSTEPCQQEMPLSKNGQFKQELKEQKGNTFEQASTGCY